MWISALVPSIAGSSRHHRFPISAKLGVIFIAFILMTIANLAVVRVMLRDINGVAATVNVAGKLRMLSQKIAFESVKRMRDIGDSEHTALLLLNDFGAGLSALKYGGSAFGLSPNRLSDRYVAQLSELEREWAHYQTIVKAALANGSAPADHAASITLITVAADRVLADAESLVTALTREAQYAQSEAMMQIYALILFDTLFLFASFIVLRRKIVYPLRELAKQSTELANGRYDYPVAITSNDEIGQLSAVFSDSARRIGELINHIKRERQDVERAESMFRGLAENAGVGVYIVQGKSFLFANPKMSAMFGYASDEMVASVSTLDIVHDLDRDLVEENIQKRLDGKVREVHYARKGRRQDGSTFDVEVFGSIMEMDNKAATIGIMLDISERKRVERALQVLSACNQALVRATDEPALLEDICRIFQKISGYPFVWVGYAGKDSPKKVMPVAYAEIEEGVLAMLAESVTWDSAPSGMDVTGEAIRTGRAAVVKNMSRNPTYTPWRSFLTKYGISTALSLPLKSGSEIIGALTVYSQDEEAFTRDEVNIAEELSENLSYGITALRTEAEKVLYAKRLEFHANHDVLTGLANRNLLSLRLKQALVSSDRTGHFVAVLLLDLDRFKVINDSLGHAAGDILLKAVANRLSSCVRGTDTVARLGGDEFVIVMPDLLNEENVKAVANKVLEVLAFPFQIAGQDRYISASIGISHYPHDGDNEDVLLKNVDLAMYRAKQSGRSNFQFYTEDIHIDNRDRHAMETELHAALQRGELVVHFQPKVDLCARKISGIEALVRWNHPTRGMISPDKFIPLAEETGLIIPIGSWVLETACLQNMAWQKAGLAPIRVAVNLSARQFRHNDLVGLVAGVLEKTGLDPQYLELELTESVIMQEAENAVSTLHELKALGLQISLDDFGTGYSSLNYLRQFPLDSLKIDRFFVKGITTHAHDTTIVKALIALAHNLDLKVTAEGVESREELEFLQNHACDEIQGFYFSKAVPADQLESLLRDAAFPFDDTVSMSG